MLTKNILEKYKNYPIFTTKDVSQLLKNKSKQEINSYIKYLVNKGSLFRIARGVYTIHKDPIVYGFAFRPFYYGLQYALTIHKLWDQATNPVVITTKKIRIETKTITGNKFIIHRIKPKYFFGYELKNINGFDVPVSDIEKTLIDFIHFQNNLDKNTLKDIIKKTNKTKIKEYLKHYPIQTKSKILNLIK